MTWAFMWTSRRSSTWISIRPIRIWERWSGLFSADPAQVKDSAQVGADAARAAGMGLCLKHFPGIGGATVNSHEELTDLSGLVPDEQLTPFYELGLHLPGSAVLVESRHLAGVGILVIPSRCRLAGIRRLREKLPEALRFSPTISRCRASKGILPSREASALAIRAGLDLILDRQQSAWPKTDFASITHAIRRPRPPRTQRSKNAAWSRSTGSKEPSASSGPNHPASRIGFHLLLHDLPH